MKVLVHLPRALAFFSEPTGELLKMTWMPDSLSPKPVPVTVTEEPVPPLVGLMETAGVTVKKTSGTLPASVTSP